MVICKKVVSKGWCKESSSLGICMLLFVKLAVLFPLLKAGYG